MNAQQLEKLCKAVANKRRLVILQYLQKSKNGLSVIEISNKLKLTFRSTSKHLQILSTEGLIESYPQGKFVIYCIATELGVNQRSLLQLVLKLLR